MAKKRLIIAMACAAVGALCMGVFLWNQARSVSRTRAELVRQFGVGTSKVLVARRRIEPGTVLSEGLFDEQLWPAIFVPEGAVVAEQLKTVLGHRTLATILGGEPLTKARVFEQQLALDTLPEGMTAVTLPTDEVHALGGELLRGMKVTLMGVLPDGRVEAIAKDIEVLSANISAVAADVANNSDLDTGDSNRSSRNALLGGQGAINGGESIVWVTLALPDNQVSQVLAASQAHTLHLVLPKTAPDSSDISDEDL